MKNIIEGFCHDPKHGVQGRQSLAPASLISYLSSLLAAVS